MAEENRTEPTIEVTEAVVTAGDVTRRNIALQEEYEMLSARHASYREELQATKAKIENKRAKILSLDSQIEERRLSLSRLGAVPSTVSVEDPSAIHVLLAGPQGQIASLTQAIREGFAAVVGSQRRLPPEKDWERLTFKPTFDDLWSIPSTLRAYKMWAEEMKMPDEIALRRLKYLLPNSLRINLVREEEQARSDKKAFIVFQSWGTALEGITLRSGEILGQNTVQSAIDGVSVEEGSNMNERFNQIEDLLYLLPKVSDRNVAAIQASAWDTLVRKAPRGVQLTMTTPKRSESIQERCAEFQRALDLYHAERKGTGSVHAVSEASRLEFSFGTTQLECVWDSGATHNIVGELSALGKQVVAAKATKPTHLVLSGPGVGPNQLQMAWEASVELQVQYFSRGETKKTCLPIILYGMKGRDEERLFVCAGTQKLWGWRYDPETNNYGIRLPSEPKLFWFPRTDVSNASSGWVHRSVPSAQVKVTGKPWHAAKQRVRGQSSGVQTPVRSPVSQQQATPKRFRGASNQQRRKVRKEN
jgi:hypothetical protein